jgi:3-hydroxyacyl-[acyl-carrier-protein] dehydratase
MSAPARGLVALLPHDPPLRLLDEAERSPHGLVAHQTIPADDLFLRAHFPGFPLWPGALLLEAMAQTTAIYLLADQGGTRSGQVPVLGAVECRFLRPVFPGDRLCYRTRLVRRLGGLGLFAVAVNRRSELVARGRISAGLVQRSALAAAPPA